MTTTGIMQMLDNASALQTASRTHRQYALHITCSAFALCAEAALTPQNSLAYATLGNIVSWLYTSILHKRPQMLAMFDNPATFAGQFALAASSLFPPLFHTVHQGCHSVLKSSPGQRSVTNPLSHLQYFLGQTIKLLTYLAHRPCGLADGLEIPFQMGPTYLTNTTKEIVSAPAVTDQGTTKGTQQLSGRPGSWAPKRPRSSSPGPCAYWC